MIDKLTGAISNGLVGYIAIAAGMTGTATAADMTAHDIRTFDSMAFYIPLAFAILAIIVFLTKVTLSEKKHAAVVEELKDQLAAGQDGATATTATAATTAATKATTIYAPVDGKLVEMKDVVDQDGQVFPGKGFAIQPTSNHIYAPFDGQVRFTFGTRHAFGIVSDDGLELLVHIGVGTVNMRGEGFVSHYNDGQVVKKGELLFDFDRQLIKRSGYQDTVVNFFTQPHRVTDVSPIAYGSTVKHGDQVTTVKFK